MQREVRPQRQPTGLDLDELAEASAEILSADYGGQPKKDGWIAALCPAGHCVDYPGKHFYFNRDLRLGHCFGRHGNLLLKALKLIMSRNLRAGRVIH
jgi:hypothetical protein